MRADSSARVALLYAAVVCASILSSHADSSYLITATNRVTPGQPYSLSVSISDDVTEDVTISGSITFRIDWNNREPDVLAEASQTFRPGETGMMTFDVDDDNNGWGHQLRLTGTGGVTFDETRSLSKSSHRLNTMIQTDKAMYKPGDTVRFRVVAIDSNLIPHNGPYDVIVYDKNENRIAQYLGKELGDEEGFISEEIQLSSQPPMGDWKIHVTVDGEEGFKHFTVDEYVLPKFEVKIDFLRPFQTPEFGNIRGTVKADYTFGEGVDGTCVLTVNAGRQSYPIEPYPVYMYDDDMEDEPFGRPGRPGPRPQPEQRMVMRHLQQGENGRFEFEITLDELKNLAFGEREARDEELGGYYFSFMAQVNETLTRKVINTTEQVQIKDKRLQLKWLDTTPTSFKPGMTLTAYVQLSQADGSNPLDTDLVTATGAPRRIRITRQYSTSEDDRYVYREETVDAEDSYDMNDEGVVVAEIPFPTDATRVTLWAYYDIDSANELRSQGNKVITKFYSLEGGAIQLTMREEEMILKADQNSRFRITSTTPLASAQYFVIIKNEIVASDDLEVNSSDLEYDFDVSISSTAVPTAKVAVVAITDADGAGEVLVDAVVLNVESQLPNEVEVEFSDEEKQPGDSVSLDVTASPRSFVGVMAVDTSVQLLKTGNDITHDDVIQAVNGFDYGDGPVYYDMIMPCCFRCWWPYYPGGTDAASALRNLGIIVVTDSYIHEHRELQLYPSYYRPASDGDDEGLRGQEGPQGPQGPPGQPGPPLESEDANVGGGAGDENVPEVERVRDNFIETWLWTDATTGPDGRVHIEATVPDTLTSWVVNALAVHREDGLGVPTETAKLRVFTPFFVTLDLPYSAIRGEILPLKVNIFNYMETSQDVLLELVESQDFLVGERVAEGSMRMGSMQTTLTIEPQSAVQRTFWIKPIRLGHIDLELTARGDNRADALRRMLLIEPEGAPEEYARSFLVDLTDRNAFSKTFEIERPEGGRLVPGSEHIEISAMGDVMSKVINDVSNLIRMPSGCGEQNMVNFVPNILVLEYLEATGLGSEEQRGQALSYLRMGYQREMTYQHTDDGSFSAFGDRDEHGSTWLTAFVVRSFRRAMQFFDGIDEAAMRRAINFLVGEMYGNGQFQERGDVHHSMLKGNSYRGVALSAYVVTALCHVRDMRDVDVERAIERGVEYLLDVEVEEEDTYTLAIVTNALQCVEHREADRLLRLLNERAETEDNGAYWPDESGQSDAEERRYCYYCHPSFEIEQTAYGMLANLHADQPLGDIIPYMTWLTKQQNSDGGFRSTQDTVLGLSALAEYAKRVYGGDSSNTLNVDVTVDARRYNDMVPQHTAILETITMHNTLLLQKHQLPSDTDTISVLATGRGVATFTLSVKYNVYINDTNPALFVHVESDTEDLQTIDVHACTRWRDEEARSGMANMEILPITGYTIDTDEFSRSHPLLKRFEMLENKLTTYWEEFPVNEDVCIDLVLRRQYEVKDPQPASIKSYSYYDPSVMSVAMYLPSSMRSDGQVIVDQCEICPSCCAEPPNPDNGTPDRCAIYPAGCEEHTAEPPRPNRPGISGSTSVMTSAGLVFVTSLLCVLALR